MCDDALHLLSGTQLANRIIRPAKLERSHALEVFALEKYGRVELGVERPRCHNRRFIPPRESQHFSEL